MNRSRRAVIDLNRQIAENRQAVLNANDADRAALVTKGKQLQVEKQIATARQQGHQQTLREIREEESAEQRLANDRRRYFAERERAERQAAAAVVRSRRAAETSARRLTRLREQHLRRLLAEEKKLEQERERQYRQEVARIRRRQQLYSNLFRSIGRLSITGGLLGFGATRVITSFIQPAIEIDNIRNSLIAFDRQCGRS